MSKPKPGPRWMDEQPVVAILAIRTPLRIGAGRGGTDVELPVLKAQRRGDSFTIDRPIVPASTFKGLLRHGVDRILESFQLDKSAREESKRLFGDKPPESTRPGMRTQEGLLKVAACSENISSLSKAQAHTRTAIRQDSRYGSVEKGALWNYEFISNETGRIILRFNLRFTFPITKLMAGLILGGLRLLTNETLGGFGSRGMGIIEEVMIESKDFVTFAEAGIKELLEGTS